jgi:cyclase
MTGTHVPNGNHPGDVRVTEVADHVFAYVQEPGGWCVSNAGLLIGPDGAAVIDTAATEARARRLRAALADLTPVPPRILVNTHFHGDHTFGNSVMSDSGTVIVAHELARQEMRTAGLGLTSLWPGVEWGAVDVRLPELTFRDRVTLRLGDLAAEAIFVGPAHTITDAVVWLPEERVLFAGDVVMPGCTPFVLMGSVSGSLRAIAALRALAPRVVVGGHGPVSGPEALDDTEGYLRWLRRTAAEGAAAGLTPLEAARAARPGEFGFWLDPERLVGNLHRAYAELRAEPEGAQLDVVGIFGEMVDFNGGRLPACYA